MNTSRRRTVAVILARTGSSRLPAKCLAEVAGAPLIAHLIERVRAVPGLDAVVLATPDLPEDRRLGEVAREAGAEVFAGAAEDVLDRLYQAARRHGADVVTHIGGDCPFVDPALVARAVAVLCESGADYACNILPQTFPSGLDVDAITIDALERLWRRATLRTTRKHPFAYIYQNRDQFRVENFAHIPDLAHLRWTLDYPEDLDFVRAVYDELQPRHRLFGMAEVMALLERRPEIGAINQGLSDFVEGQPAFWDSEGYLGDLRSDLIDVLNEATVADRERRYNDAENGYRVGRAFLDDLHQRAKALRGAQSK